MVWAGWWVLFGIVSGIVEGLNFTGVLAHTAMPGLIFLVSILVTWWQKVVGGIVLIIEGLIALIVYPIVDAYLPVKTILFVLLTMALPPIIIGVLFMLSWSGEKFPHPLH
jgi:hypothetical protein